MRSGSTAELRRLARMHGVQTSYVDASGKRRTASPESLEGVLRALGVEFEMTNLAQSILAHEELHWRLLADPVTVVRSNSAGRVAVRLPASAEAVVECSLELEHGEKCSWKAQARAQRGAKRLRIGSVAYSERTLELPGTLPTGYHTLHLRAGSAEGQSLIISAPTRCHVDPAPRWGAFLPLYALRTQQTLGNADFTDFEQLIDWIAESGGSLVGTLPLLASFLGEPFEPSPYSPASRLFWNELYVDPRRSPDFAQCEEARALLEDATLRAELARQRDAAALDYQAVERARRRILDALARHARSHPDPEFGEHLRAHPQVADYARFRAVGERLRTGWPAWPERQQNGELRHGDYDEDAFQYHCYVQWLAHLQLETLKSHTHGVSVYLDLPLGVHSNSYDVWRDRSLFATSATAGAPPDPFFTKGQNWGFPPTHPEAQRKTGYAYFRQCLQNLMRYSGILRLDHVMVLHRLYWVPEGKEATDGAYVRYPADELYAVLAIESNRHECMVVGEDLGTVPAEVRSAMRKHGVQRMYVVQFEATPNDPPLQDPPGVSVASMNTHDMPTFAAYWEGLDVADREELGLLDGNGAREELASRARLRKSIARFLKEKLGRKTLPRTAADALHAMLLYLASSDARVILINLEDLWLETRPQNVPGTWRERPNWSRRAQYTLEQMRELPAVQKTFRDVKELRDEHGSE
jgi:4-alpha-glucanotransferase